MTRSGTGIVKSSFLKSPDTLQKIDIATFNLNAAEIGSCEDLGANARRKMIDHRGLPKGVMYSQAFRGNEKPPYLVMRSLLRFARIIAIQSAIDQKEGVHMKGSITFRFAGDPNNYRVHISRQGELDSGDLEVVAALLNEDIELQKSIEASEITPTSSDPTGRGHLRDTWSN